MLPKRLDAVIDLSGAKFSSPEIGKPFYIGSDGGEEMYFVDASKPDSGCFGLRDEDGQASFARANLRSLSRPHPHYSRRDRG